MTTIVNYDFVELIKLILQVTLILFFWQNAVNKRNPMFGLISEESWKSEHIEEVCLYIFFIKVYSISKPKQK
jgi:hypothetical protein